MDPSKVNSTMQSLAFGEAMKAAAQDYKELLATEKASKGPVHARVNILDFQDDPELQRLHQERLEALKEGYERRPKEEGHGQYQEIQEGQFLEITTKTPRVVCHFFHSEFRRCRILDRHLESLARLHERTRFIKLDATAAPFFAEKLKVRILPCLIFFVRGIAVGRLIGFDEFEKKDDFSTSDLEEKLLEVGVIDPIVRQTEPATNVRRGLMHGKLDSEDESSDFD